LPDHPKPKTNKSVVPAVQMKVFKVPRAKAVGLQLTQTGEGRWKERSGWDWRRGRFMNQD
jgi:hypothetical protein